MLLQASVSVKKSKYDLIITGYLWQRPEQTPNTHLGKTVPRASHQLWRVNLLHQLYNLKNATEFYMHQNISSNAGVSNPRAAHQY